MDGWSYDGIGRGIVTFAVLAGSYLARVRDISGWGGRGTSWGISLLGPDHHALQCRIYFEKNSMQNIGEERRAEEDANLILRDSGFFLFSLEKQNSVAFFKYIRMHTHHTYTCCKHLVYH